MVPGTEETVRVANTSGAGVGTPTSGATSGNPVPASSTGGVGSRDDFPAPVPLDGDLPSTPVNTGTAGGSPGTRVVCGPALVATPLGAADTVGTLMHFSKERVKGQSPEALQAEAKTCYDLYLKTGQAASAIMDYVSRPDGEDTGPLSGNHAFVFVSEDTTKFVLVHSLGRCVLPRGCDDNEADGGIFGFVSDRLVVNDRFIQDPHAVGLNLSVMAGNWDELQRAPKKAADEATDIGKLLDPRNGTRVEAGRLMPIPWAWVPFFLEKDRDPLEAYKFLTDKTAQWTAPAPKDTRDNILKWFRLAATADPDRPEASPTSILGINWIPVDLPNAAFSKWAIIHLDQVLPRARPADPQTSIVTPSPPQLQQVPQLSGGGATEAGIQHQLGRLLQSWADKEEREDRRRQEKEAGGKAKELPEQILHNLLKWAGLTIDTADKLPPMWKALCQLTTKEQRYAYIRARFAELADKNAGFFQFENRQLMDDILSYNLAPGATGDRIHTGLSPLAFLMRPAEVNQQLADAYDSLDRATAITPADVTKHTSKGPPPPPTSVADMVSVFGMMEDFLLQWFGRYCSLWEKVRGFRHGLSRLQVTLMGRDGVLRFLIPQSHWAIIKDTRQFFLQSASLADVTDEGFFTLPSPLRADSELDTLSAQLLQLQDVRPLDMPRQLLAPFSNEETDATGTKRSWESPGAALPPPEKPSLPGGTDTSKRKKKAAWSFNTDQPKIFAGDRELQALLHKRPNTVISEVTKAAGFQKLADVPNGNLPPTLCKNHGVMKRCHDNCWLLPRGHQPASAWPESGQQTFLAAIRPGIVKLLNSTGQESPPDRT